MKVLVNGGLNLSELDGPRARLIPLKLGGRLEMAANMEMTLPGTRPKLRVFMRYSRKRSSRSSMPAMSKESRRPGLAACAKAWPA